MLLLLILQFQDPYLYYYYCYYYITTNVTTRITYANLRHTCWQTYNYIIVVGDRFCATNGVHWKLQITVQPKENDIQKLDVEGGIGGR